MNDATVSEGQHEAVLRGVVLAILRRGSPGVARIESSILYRSFLYASLSHVLSLMNVPSLDGGLASRSSSYDQDAIGAYEAAALEFRVRNMVRFPLALLLFYFFPNLLNTDACCAL
jgi:hypothetical protein